VECVLIDECLAAYESDTLPQLMGVGACCNSTVGAVEQVCRAGFTKVNGTCVDINECALSLSSCMAPSTCQNVVGGYTCACPVGYTGSGLPPFGCQNTTSNCNQAIAISTNSSRSVSFSLTSTLAFQFKRFANTMGAPNYGLWHSFVGNGRNVTIVAQGTTASLYPIIECWDSCLSTAPLARAPLFQQGSSLTLLTVSGEIYLVLVGGDRPGSITLKLNTTNSNSSVVSVPPTSSHLMTTPQTVAGDQCILPFFYHGQQYNSCVPGLAPNQTDNPVYNFMECAFLPGVANSFPAVASLDACSTSCTGGLNRYMLTAPAGNSSVFCQCTNS
jgi:hypothetical protein